jgi:hypothetical protein
MDQSLVSSSWAEHFQSGCEGVEEIQPLLKLTGANSPPQIPNQYPSGAPLFSQGKYPALADSCRLALEWALYAKKNNAPRFQEAASKLAGWLLPQIRTRLTTLWTTDQSHDEKETRISTALFLLACGLGDEAAPLYSPDLPKTALYARLFRENLHIDPASDSASEPALGYQLLQTASSSLALTLCGKGSGIGAFRLGDLSVPSFGPQTAPLSDSKLFGLNTPFSDGGWFLSASSKETWFQIESRIDSSAISFKWNQIGINPQKPIALVFYLAADACRIDNKVFKPKSLQRFIGESSQLLIDARATKAILQLDRPLKIELIPLAGEGCYWNATFLLALWLPPFDTTLSLQLKENN